MWKTLGLAALLPAAALGQWNRYLEFSEDRVEIDAPSAHALRYFEADPCLRDPADAVRKSIDCGEDPHQVWRRAGKVTRAGTLGGSLGVFEVRHSLSSADDPPDWPPPVLRSILIETAPGAFHEICVQEIAMDPWSEGPGQVSIARSNVPWIVADSYDEGGNYHFRFLKFFAVRKTGAVQLDLSPLDRAATAALPPKQELNGYIQTIDYDALVYTIGTQRTDTYSGPKVSCCEGTVTVRFRLQGIKLVPLRATYRKEPER